MDFSVFSDSGQELRFIKELGDLQKGICLLQPGCLTAKSVGETWHGKKNTISDCLVSIFAGQGGTSSSTVSTTFAGVLPSTQQDSPVPHFLVCIRARRCLEMPIVAKCGSAWTTSKSCDLLLLLCILDVLQLSLFVVVHLGWSDLCLDLWKQFHATETCWLENVLGFVRVIDRVLAHISENLPENLILNDDWLWCFLPCFWNNNHVKHM